MDLVSWGGFVNEENVFWWEGLKWLKDLESWFLDIVIIVIIELNVEVKVIKEFFVLVVE